jgi:Holliday junction resolvase
MAKYLVENYGFKRFSFAEGVKKVAIDYFGMEGKDRTLLQALGHGLRQIDPLVWVKYTINKFDENETDFVVIDDLRYPNEYEALKRLGFTIVKLVGRQKPMTEAQKAHESEQFWQMMQEDIVIDSSKPADECFRHLDRVLGQVLIEGGNLDMRYYEKAKEASNKNYIRGRNFEYRVMKKLRKAGWHCMRKFGSHDDKYTENGVRKSASLDVTAFKNGVYLLISCKFSIKGPTSWMDDPKWRELRDYAKKFGAIGVFAGVSATRRIYFVNLNNLKPMKLKQLEALGVNYRHKLKKADASQMQKLLDYAWKLLEILDIEYHKAEKQADRQKWANNLVSLVNIINRLIWRSGDTGSQEDLTKFFEEAEKTLEKIKEENGNAV